LTVDFRNQEEREDKYPGKPRVRNNSSFATQVRKALHLECGLFQRKLEKLTLFTVKNA
jgi:hypothetical protein